MPEVFNSASSQPPSDSSEQKSPLESEVSLPPPKGGLFSSFLCQPSWVSFDTKDDNEKVILLLRQHWVVNVPWVLLALVMIAAPSVLSFFPILEFLPAKFQLMAVSFWYLLTLAFIFERFLSWFYNIFIVTDKRVIDIDFLNLIYKQVSECHFSEIESLTYTQGGFVRAMFNFGTVLVQTAAEIENIEFEDVPVPADVSKIINSLVPERDSK